MLRVEDTALVIIDVQEKLSRVVYEKEKLFENLQKIVAGAQILEIPIVLTEQNPDGLGLTIPQLSGLLADVQPIVKFSFSCCGEERFVRALEALQRRQVLIAGIETHVCVYQTAMDLLDAGYEVQVVSDAVTSRTAENRELGLERMRSEGARLTGTEMALFELLRVAEGKKFKDMLKVVK